MPDMISEEQLEALRKENQRLREEDARVAAETAEAELAKQREFEAQQLLVENRRIEARVAASKARLEQVTGVQADQNNESNARDLAAAQAALENPQGVPVDTNSGVEGEPVVIDENADAAPEQTSTDAQDPANQVGELTEPLTPAEQADENDDDKSESVEPPSVSTVFHQEFDTQTPADEPEGSDDEGGDAPDDADELDGDDKNGGTF